jgi:hypothetical protein
MFATRTCCFATTCGRSNPPVLELPADTPPDTLLVVHEALEKLAAEDAPKAELVRLRFFIGSTNPRSAPERREDAAARRPYFAKQMKPEQEIFEQAIALPSREAREG